MSYWNTPRKSSKYFRRNPAWPYTTQLLDPPAWSSWRSNNRLSHYYTLEQYTIGMLQSFWMVPANCQYYLHLWCNTQPYNTWQTNNSKTQLILRCQDDCKNIFKSRIILFIFHSEPLQINNIRGQIVPQDFREKICFILWYHFLWIPEGNLNMFGHRGWVSVVFLGHKIVSLHEPIDYCNTHFHHCSKGKQEYPIHWWSWKETLWTFIFYP